MLLSIYDAMGLFLSIVLQVIQIYIYVLFVYILLSWVEPIRNSKFYYYYGKICEPYLRIFRGRFIFGNMDWGTLIAILALQGLMYLILAIAT
jgi:YggT family protein